MNTVKIFCPLLITLTLTSILSSCAIFGGGDITDKSITKLDSCGCPIPSVFQVNNAHLTFAQSALGNVVLGSIDINTDNELHNLASQAATDELVKAYIRCHEIKCEGFTQDQSLWFRSLLEYKGTSPSPDQMSSWMRENPRPGTQPVKLIASNKRNIFTSQNWRIQSMSGQLGWDPSEPIDSIRFDVNEVGQPRTYAAVFHHDGSVLRDTIKRIAVLRWEFNDNGKFQVEDNGSGHSPTSFFYGGSWHGKWDNGSSRPATLLLSNPKAEVIFNISDLRTDRITLTAGDEGADIGISNVRVKTIVLVPII